MHGCIQRICVFVVASKHRGVLKERRKERVHWLTASDMWETFPGRVRPVCTTLPGYGATLCMLASSMLANSLKASIVVVPVQSF